MRNHLTKHVYVIGNQKQLLPSNEFTGGCSDLLLALQKEGFVLSEDPSSEYLLALDHNQRQYKEFRKRGGLISKSVLVRLEPSSVLPFQYKSSILNKYGKVFSPGSIQKLQSDQDALLQYPYRYSETPLMPRVSDKNYLEIFKENLENGDFKIANWKQRSIQIAMIASNKVGASFDNNYGKRREVAKIADAFQISIYGTKWNDPIRSRFKYRLGILKNSLLNHYIPNVFALLPGLFTKFPQVYGEVSDRSSILRASKFSIVIENSNDAITEKMFDAMLFGSIPVFYGPDPAQFDIPSKTYLRIGNDLESSLEELDNMSLSEIEEMLDQICSFIASEHFANTRSSRSVYSLIARRIHQFYFNQKS